MQYRLRTLLIVLMLGPPLLAGGWRGWQSWREGNEEKLGIEVIDGPIATNPQGTTVILPDFAFAPVSIKGPADGGKVLLGGIRRMRQKQWWRRLTGWHGWRESNEEKLVIEIIDESTATEPQR